MVNKMMIAKKLYNLARARFYHSVLNNVLTPDFI